MAARELPEPANRDIGRPPLDLEASNVTFASRSATLIHGWLSHGKPGQGAVILLHGLRGDRRDMLSRAEFLRARGYSVLLFDFQAHGETRGRQVTFGYLESRDVTAAIQYLRYKMPNERIGIIGVSLGAVAYVLAENRPPVAAVVLEQLYPTTQDAVSSRARTRVGPFAPLIAPLLMVQMQSRLEIPANRLRPIDAMSKVGAPLLMVNGTKDNHTSIEDARALFAAASEPKELWAVAGAEHVNLHTFAKAEYERRVGEFFERYLAASPLAAPASEEYPDSNPLR